VTEGRHAFSTKLPQVITGSTPQPWAFNLDSPQGIKLLSRRVAERLDEHIKGAAGRFSANSEILSPSDGLLWEHGLIRRRGQFRLKPAETTPSLSIWLNIVDGCNLSCFYCYIPDLQKSVNPEALGLDRLAMNEVTGEIIAARLVEYCQSQGLRRLRVKFAGGEPSLVIDRVDRFCEAVERRASRLGIAVSFSMLSNAAFDPERVLPVLKRRRMGIGISLDGTQMQHDRVRFTRNGSGRVGTWHTIQRNVERLLQVGVRPYFLFTVTRKNLPDLDSFADHVHGLGCGFRLSLERSSRPVDFRLQEATSDALIGFYSRLAERAPLDLRFDHDARFAEWDLHRRKAVACSTCRSYVAISRTGEVASCQMALDRPIGNLLTDPLSDAIERFSARPDTVKLREPQKKTGGCTRCEYRNVCAGGCPQHTQAVSGNSDQPSPWCFVYGTLLPHYVAACATHLIRRAASLTERVAIPSEATPVTS
jgi:uncharacterized protein